MALTTVGASADNKQSNGSTTNVVHRTITFLGDAAYATGGSAGFTAFVRGVLADGQEYEVLAISQVSPSGDLALLYDKANDKLMVFDRTDGSEEANAANHAATTFVVDVTLI